MEVPEAGKVYRNCAVKSVKDFGCFVEILPGKEALCHISELDDRRNAVLALRRRPLRRGTSRRAGELNVIELLLSHSLMVQKVCIQKMQADSGARYIGQIWPRGVRRAIAEKHYPA